MAEIRPFRGLRFNPKLVGDLGVVLCPPYDIISPEAQQAFHQKSDFNIIRLEYGLESPGDTPAHNRYTRAAATLENWLQQQALLVEDRPAIYLHDHYFTYKGRLLRRRGIIACVRLEEWERGVMRPHEETRAEAKADRLNLLRACQANLSPIFALYDDPEQRIACLMEGEEQNSSTARAVDSQGDSHELWAITQPEVFREVADSLAFQPLYIADGHHRYETALAYLRERRAGQARWSGKEAANFVMMTLVDASAPGLVILPLHRLVRGIPAPTLAGLRERLERFFRLSSFLLTETDLSPQFDSLLNYMKLRGDTTMGLFGLEPRQVLLLTLCQPGFASKPRAYIETDVGVLHDIVLEGILGINSQAGEKEGKLAYSHDEKEAAEQVLTGEYQLLFLLNPMGIEQLKAIADTKQRAHPKSTYFYPKLPTGLVINRLLGEI